MADATCSECGLPLYLTKTEALMLNCSGTHFLEEGGTLVPVRTAGLRLGNPSKMVACDYGEDVQVGNFCVLPDEMILGDNRQIQHLEPGALVTGLRAERHQVESVIQRQYSGTLVRIKAHGSVPISVTPDHPLLTAQIKFKRIGTRFEPTVNGLRWKKAADVRVGEFLVSPKLTSMKVTQHIPEDLAELMGLYCAEGSVRKHPSRNSWTVTLTLGQHEKELVKRAASLFRDITGKEPNFFDIEGSTRVNCASESLALLLRDSVGISSYSKHIPDSVLYGPDLSLKAFLDGYISGDGYPSPPPYDGRGFGTTSKLLALQIQLAMTRFGRRVNLREQRRPKFGFIKGRRVRLSTQYIGYIPNQIHRRTVPSDSENFYPRVKRIDKVPYTGPVFNLQVEGTSSFSIGNVVTHNCDLYKCSIGAHTKVKHYVEIQAGVKVGKFCKIESFVFIPEGVVIGNYVFLGPATVFLNDKYPSAVGPWEMKLTVVEDNVSIGAGVVVLPGVKIGRNSLIGAGAVVTKSIPADSIAYGNPAKVVRPL